MPEATRESVAMDGLPIERAAIGVGGAWRCEDATVCAAGTTKQLSCANLALRSRRDVRVMVAEIESPAEAGLSETPAARDYFAAFLAGAFLATTGAFGVAATLVTAFLTVLPARALP